MSKPAYWSELSGLVAESGAADAAHRRIRACDGFELDVYEMGQGQPEKLLIVNSLGLPFLLVSRLARALARRYHVIAWDSRGSPETARPFEDAYAAIGRQSADLIDIQRHFQGGIAHAVTWSSGAFPLLDAMDKGAAFASAVLLAPSDIGSVENRTPFQQFFYPLFLKAAGGDAASIARLRKVILASKNRLDDDSAQSLATLYTRSAEATRRYVLYFQAVLGFRQRSRELYAALSRHCEFLVIHSTNDTYADYRGSVAAFEEGSHTKLILHKSGGHFMLYARPDEVAGDIEAYIGNRRRPLADAPLDPFYARVAA